MARRRRGSLARADLGACLLGARAKLALRLGNGLDVLAGGLIARAAAARVQLPGRDDDLFLRFDQGLEAAVVLHPAALPHRLALRGHELFFERLDLEEEDVAARLGRSAAAVDVARARVIGHEVARLHAQILHEQRVPGGRGQRRRFVAASGTVRSLAARRLEHQLERLDAVVVIGPRLDGDFFERRDVLVARRADDSHVRRAIVERADEVLRVAGGFETIAIDQRDAIGAVVFNRQPAVSTVPLTFSATREPSSSTSAADAIGLSAVTDRRTSVPAGP